MSPEIQRHLTAQILRIRRVEEAIAENYSRREMRCPVHLSIGQEVPPVALCSQLNEKDHLYSNHRCHAHYLAKGGDLNAMIAELHGKRTGCCEGKGGSMHLVWPEAGMMGASALVGGTIPLGVGSALAFKMAGEPRVAVSFFGDGASEEGVFFESMNFAQLKRLPMIFVCENNRYATYSHQRARQAHLDITRRAAAFGMKAMRVDGSHLETSVAAAEAAVTRARRGEGPTLIEFATYRWRDHVGPAEDTNIGYRTQEELDEWKARCPLNRLPEIFSPEELATLEESLKNEIERAFAFARSSSQPLPRDVTKDVYAHP